MQVPLYPWASRTAVRRVGRTDILVFMRTYALLFAFISLVMLVMFFIYVVRGPVDPLIAAGLFLSFLACAAPALLLLKPLARHKLFSGTPASASLRILMS